MTNSTMKRMKKSWLTCLCQKLAHASEPADLPLEVNEKQLQQREDNSDISSPSPIPRQNLKSRRVSMESNVPQQFPEKLYHMLELADAQGFGPSSNAVSWLPNGRAFSVRDEKVFMESIVPLFFHQTKLRSFKRQLNLWGFKFKRLNTGDGSRTYCHEHFVRGSPEELRFMVRIRIKSKPNVNQKKHTHNNEQHNEENAEEHAKEDTSEPNDEQSDKEDKKSEEEQHAKDGKSSDDMSISEESSEPAAKKKKGSNSNCTQVSHGSLSDISSPSQIPRQNLKFRLRVSMESNVPQQFPEKLYHMLELADAQGFGPSSNAVSWLPNGRAFSVRDEKVFMESIVPLFFHQTKLRSFKRQLNLWGFKFKRLNTGDGSRTYCHEHFVRGSPEELRFMVRIRIKSKPNVNQKKHTHNNEQHNEENAEEHAKEDTSEPNDEQSDKEDKKSEEEQHAKDGKSSDDMSISEESVFEPAAKKKKGSNSEENTASREDSEDPVEKCKELMTYFGERAKYDKLEIDIDELFDDLKPVYDDIRELNEQIGELRKKQDKLTEVDKLLRAADKLSHDNGLDYLFDGGFDQKLQDSNDARVKLREEAAGLFGELRGKCVLVDAEQKKIEDELRRRSRTYDRELGLKYRSTPESVLPLKRRIQAKGLSMLESCSRLVQDKLALGAFPKLGGSLGGLAGAGKVIGSPVTSTSSLGKNL